MVKPELWEQDLPEDHRAVLKLVRERTYGASEQRAVDELSFADLCVRYADLLLSEVVRIPAATPVVPCRWCQKPICWIPNRAGAKSPITDKRYLEAISIATPDGIAPLPDTAGEGVPHHADCTFSIYRNAPRLAELKRGADS